MARSGSAATAVQQPDRAGPPAPRWWRASNRSVAYSSTPIDAGGLTVGRCCSRRARATGRTWRWRSAPAATDVPQPRQARASARALFCSTSITWNSGMARQRARRVEHLHQPLERQVLVGHRRPGLPRAPGRAGRGSSGLPDVSVRSTRVLTKKPTRSSSALSVRPGDRAADRDVVAGPQPLSRAARPACSTMNRLAPAAARQRQQLLVQLGSISRCGTLLAAIARDRRPRPVGRQLELPPGSPASVCVQNASWRAIRLSGSLSAPSSSCCHSV